MLEIWKRTLQYTTQAINRPVIVLFTTQEYRNAIYNFDMCHIYKEKLIAL